MTTIDKYALAVLLCACTASEPLAEAPLDDCTGKCDAPQSWFAGSVRRITPPTSGYRYGHSVANVGDIDGDDHDDLAIGEPGTARGRVYIYSGRAQTLVYTIDGEGGGFGHVVRGIGDLDADGVSDVAVGAPTAPGLVYLYSAGQPRRLIRRLGGVGTRSLGESVVDAGDVDGDGVSDIAAGGSDYNFWCSRGLGGTGFVQVYSGRLGRLLTTVEGFKYDRLGAALANPGDLDFDGYPDLVVGSPQEGYYEHTGGAVVALSGAARGKVCGEYLERPSAFYVARGWQYDELGAAVAALGDIDGDAVAEIAASAPGEGAGAVSIFSGATGDPLYQVFDQHYFAESRFGQSLASVGDIDGDQIADLAIGLYRSVQVHSGATGEMVARYPRFEIGWRTSNSWIATLTDGATGCRRLVVSGASGYVTFLPLPCVD
jgi:hypothetical protein